LENKRSSLERKRKRKGAFGKEKEETLEKGNRKIKGRIALLPQSVFFPLFFL